jgi:hypothetical protein
MNLAKVDNKTKEKEQGGGKGKGGKGRKGKKKETCTCNFCRIKGLMKPRATSYGTRTS